MFYEVLTEKKANFGVRYNIEHARKSTRSTERELKALRDREFPGKRAFDDEVEDAHVRKAQRRARLLGAGAGVVAGGLLGYGLKRGINSGRNMSAVRDAFDKNFGNFNPATQVSPTLINEVKGTVPYALGGAALGGLLGRAGAGHLAENEARVDIDRARDAHMRELATRAVLQRGNTRGQEKRGWVEENVALALGGGLGALGANAGRKRMRRSGMSEDEIDATQSHAGGAARGAGKTFGYGVGGMVGGAIGGKILGGAASKLLGKRGLGLRGARWGLMGGALGGPGYGLYRGYKGELEKADAAIRRKKT